MSTTEFRPDVLVVDDEREQICVFLKHFYTDKGHRVLTATNAEKAVRIANQNRGRPTVALVDIGLPGRMDGIQLIGHLTQYATHVACYVITGDSDVEKHRAAKWAGAIDVFVKPLQDDDLNRAVESPLVPKLVTDNLHDFLTGFQLRRVFEETADGQIHAARRRQEPLSLLFIDINDFKETNDTLGHEVGDELLVAVTSAIREVLRVYDRPGRWGGDELTILLPGISRGEAYRRAANIKDRVSKIILEVSGGKKIIPSLSIGVASLRPSDKNIRDLCRRADKLMYQDKDRYKASKAS